METISYEEEVKKLYDLAVKEKDIPMALKLLKILTDGKASGDPEVGGEDSIPEFTG